MRTTVQMPFILGPPSPISFSCETETKSNHSNLWGVAGWRVGMGVGAEGWYV